MEAGDRDPPGRPPQRPARKTRDRARWVAACLGLLTYGFGARPSPAQSSISVQQPGSCKTDFKIEIQGGASGVSIRQQGSSNMLRSEQRDGKTMIEIGGPQCFYRITVETVTGAR